MMDTKGYSKYTDAFKRKYEKILKSKTAKMKEKHTTTNECSQIHPRY